MSVERHYYFIRANGSTAHADPKLPNCFVKDEPPVPTKGYLNHVPYCLQESIARIGWPDTGDLREAPKTGALARCYDLAALPAHIQRYLVLFRDIPLGSVVLVPDKGNPGELIIGEVHRAYDYFHQPPRHAYENAHRVGVQWDTLRGDPIWYSCEELSISPRGGFWTRAFHRIDATQRPRVITAIDATRMKRGIGVKR